MQINNIVMAQIKNTQYSQHEDVSKKQRLKTKEDPFDDTADQSCMEKIQKKFESCTDVLANYFECVRVFSNQKLEQLRKKSLEQENQSEIKSEMSLENSQKFSELQKIPDFKNFTKKEKDLLIEDFDELPAQFYQTNKVLRFTKRYAQIYDQSYSERKKRFGYTFQEVEFEREKQYQKKEKNFWSEVKRLICCRGGNYIEELEQRQRQSDPQSMSQIKSQSKKSDKKKGQDNIFMFQEDGPVQNPQQIPQNYEQKNTSKKNEIVKEQNLYMNSSRKTQVLENKNQKQNEAEARKISSRLGVDTKLVIKRKEHETKTNDEYNADITDIQHSPSGKVKNNQSNNIKTATNSERTGSYGNIGSNNNQTQQQRNRFNIQDNYFNEGDQSNSQQNINELDDGGIDWNRNRRFQDGVAKVKVDKKAKMSKMMKQVQNQNDEQFNPNQVIFYSDDVKNNEEANNNQNYDNPNSTNNNNYTTNNDNNNNNFSDNYNNNYDNHSNNNNNYNSNNNNNNNNNNNKNNNNNNNNNNDYNYDYNNNNSNNGNNYANNSYSNDMNDDPRGHTMNNSSFLNDYQQDTLNMSNTSQLNNSNYQRVKKAKAKNKNRDMIKRSFENIEEEDKIQFVDDTSFNQQAHISNQEQNTTGRNNKNSSVPLIVKDHQDSNNDLNLDDIPSVNNSAIHQGQYEAFKKKRKVKNNLTNQLNEQNGDDDMIIIEHNNQNNYGNESTMRNEQDYGNYEQYQNRQGAQMKESVVAPPPQQMKKKKNKRRNNLIVEGDVDQEAIDLDNF